MSPLTLLLMPQEYAVCSISIKENAGPVISSLPTQGFWSLTQTYDELSLVVETRYAPPDVKAEYGWRLVRVAGTLDFALVGILANLTAILADAGVACFVISTFDTDYVMVKDDVWESARDAWTAAGHIVVI